MKSRKPRKARTSRKALKHSAPGIPLLVDLTSHVPSAYVSSPAELRALNALERQQSTRVLALIAEIREGVPTEQRALVDKLELVCRALRQTVADLIDVELRELVRAQLGMAPGGVFATKNRGHDDAQTNKNVH